jgi:predicted  nucleic acid-binding Zn-ribbon protein
MNPLQSGTLAGTGSFKCESCGYVVTTDGAARLTPCPSCGSTSFERASLFAVGRSRTADDESARPDMIEEARLMAEGNGPWLAFSDGGRTRVADINRAHMRVGRSLTAEIRLDDSTVSRRHALLVLEDDGATVRVLDDRSLNGVFVNGDRVQSRVLQDGDELMVGRYKMRFLAGRPDILAAQPGLKTATG